MGDTWVSDLRHFVDESGDWPHDMSVPAFKLARFLGSIVEWVTSHDGGLDEQTNVPCRRAPGRHPCRGGVFARLEVDQGTIRWECPLCGDNGYISGWQDMLCDRRSIAAWYCLAAHSGAPVEPRRHSGSQLNVDPLAARNTSNEGGSNAVR